MAVLTPLEELNARRKGYRIGTEIDPQQMLSRINTYLNLGQDTSRDDVIRQYQASWETDPEVTGQLGDYRRLNVWSRQHPEDRLSLDIRGGGQTASGIPAIFLKSRYASGMGGSETVIGSKLFKQGNAWTMETPEKSLADIIQASYESAAHVRSIAQAGTERAKRSAQQEMFAMLSRNVPDQRYEELRAQHHIPMGIEQVYGIPSAGELKRASSSIAIYMPPKAGESETIEEMENYIYYNQVQGGVQRANRLAGRLLNFGLFAPKRVEAGAWRLEQIADTRYASRYGEDRWEAFAYRGAGKDTATDPYGLLKHTKTSTMWTRSRQEVMPLRKTESGYELIRPTAIGQTSTQSPERGSGFYGGYGGYVQSGALFPEERTPSNVYLTRALFTNVPTHSGAGITSPEMESSVDAYGIPLYETMPLPASTVEELMALQITNKKGKQQKPIVGATIAAGASINLVSLLQKAINPATGQVEKEMARRIATSKREYERTIVGASMVIAPYMNSMTGEFVASRDLEDIENRANIVPTDKLATELEKIWSPLGVKIERSGTGGPMLALSHIGIVSAGDKGYAGLKYGATPVSGKKRLGIYNAGGQIVEEYGVVTQETKQIAESMASAFGIQSHKNKIDMLNMLSPQLSGWFESHYSEGEPVSLQAIADEYGKLTRDGKKTHYIEVFGDLLRKFKGAGEDENKANLERFGIGKVSGWVYSGAVTTDFRQSMLADLHDMIGKRDNITAIKDDAERAAAIDAEINKLVMFDRDKKTGMYDSYFMSTAGFQMTLGVKRAVEWPGRGGALNPDAVNSLISKFPGFAAAVGLKPEEGPLNTNAERTKGAKAWLETAKVYELNAAASEGNLRAPSKGQANVITSEMSRDILENVIGKGIKEKWSEQETLQALVGKMGSDTLYFPAAGRYLMSPIAATGLETFDRGVDPGKGKTYYAQSYISVLREMLSAQMNGVQGTGTLRQYQEFIGGPQSRIGRDITSGKGILRHILGGEISGAIGGRYRVLNSLKPGEAYVPDSELVRMGRSMGLKTNSELQSFTRHVNANGAPMIFWRYPHLSGELGATPMQLVTSRQLAKRGVDVSAYQSLGPGTVYINPFNIESFIGDEDLDPHGWAIGLRPYKEDIVVKDAQSGEERNKRVTRFKDILTSDVGWRDAMNVHGNSTRQAEHHNLELVVGDKAAKEFSVMHKALSEFVENKDITASADDYGFVDARHLKYAAEIQRQINARKGTTYNAVKAIERAADVMGIDQSITKELVKGLPLVYQRSLESNKEASEQTGLERMLNTFRFMATRDQSGPGMRLTGAHSAVEGTFKPQFFSTPWQSGSLDEEYTGFVRSNLAKGITSVKDMSNEAVAAALATSDPNKPEIFKENYQQILGRLKSSGATGAERYLALIGEFGKEKETDMIASGQVSMYSMLGTMLMGVAAARTMRKAPMEDATRYAISGDEYRVIPWRGQMYTVSELAELNDMKSFRQVYGMTTGRGLMGRENRLPSAKILEDLQKNLLTTWGLDPMNPDPNKVKGLPFWVRQIYGWNQYLGYNKGTPAKVPGEPSYDEIGKRMEQGPEVLHASTISEITAHGAYAPQAVVKATMNWMATMFPGLDEWRSRDLIQSSMSSQNVINQGNRYEGDVARMAIADRRDPIRNRWFLIPRNPRVGQLTAKIGGKMVTGLPDFMRMAEGPNGQEYLEIMETKLGAGRENVGGIQGAIYANILNELGHRAKAQKGETPLRQALTQMVGESEEYYRADLLPSSNPKVGKRWTGNLPQVGFVDRAIEAIKEERIKVYSGFNKYGDNEFSAWPEMKEVDWRKVGGAADVEYAHKYIKSNYPSSVERLETFLEYGWRGGEAGQDREALTQKALGAMTPEYWARIRKISAQQLNRLTKTHMNTQGSSTKGSRKTKKQVVTGDDAADSDVLSNTTSPTLATQSANDPIQVEANEQVTQQAGVTSAQSVDVAQQLIDTIATPIATAIGTVLNQMGFGGNSGGPQDPGGLGPNPNYFRGGVNPRWTSAQRTNQVMTGLLAFGDIAASQKDPAETVFGKIANMMQAMTSKFTEMTGEDVGNTFLDNAKFIQEMKSGAIPMSDEVKNEMETRLKAIQEAVAPVQKALPKMLAAQQAAGPGGRLDLEPLASDPTIQAEYKAMTAMLNESGAANQLGLYAAIGNEAPVTGGGRRSAARAKKNFEAMMSVAGKMKPEAEHWVSEIEKQTGMSLREIVDEGDYDKLQEFLNKPENAGASRAFKRAGRIGSAVGEALETGDNEAVRLMAETQSSIIGPTGIKGRGVKGLEQGLAVRQVTETGKNLNRLERQLKSKFGVTFEELAGGASPTGATTEEVGQWLSDQMSRTGVQNELGLVKKNASELEAYTEEVGGMSPAAKRAVNAARVTNALGIATPVQESAAVRPFGNMSQDALGQFGGRLVQSMESLDKSTNKLIDQNKANYEQLTKKGKQDEQLVRATERQNEIAVLQQKRSDITRQFGLENVRVNAQGQAVRGDTGEALTQQETAALGQVAAIRAREGEIAGEGVTDYQRMKPGAKIGHAVRGIFGGFGWMFMERQIMGTALGGLTAGYGAWEEGTAQRNQSMLAAYGMGAPYQSLPSQQYQRALYRQGGALGIGMMGFRASTMGTPYQDMINTGRAAAGVGMAAAFLTGELAPIFPALGAALPWIAGGAGLLAGAGMLGAQQYGYMKYPGEAMGTATANALIGMQRGQSANQAVNSLSSQWYLFGASLNPQMQQQAAAAGYTIPRVPESASKPWTQQTWQERLQNGPGATFNRWLSGASSTNAYLTQQTQKTIALVEQYRRGILNRVPTQAEMMQINEGLIQGGYMPNLLPEAINTAGYRLNAAGIGNYALQERLGTQLQVGGQPEEVAKTILMARGQPLTEQAILNTTAEVPVQLLGQQLTQQQFQAVQQIPFRYREKAGMTGAALTSQVAEQYLNTTIGGRYNDIVGLAAQTTEGALLAGFGETSLSPMAINNMTPAQALATGGQFLNTSRLQQSAVQQLTNYGVAGRNNWNNMRYAVQEGLGSMEYGGTMAMQYTPQWQQMTQFLGGNTQMAGQLMAPAITAAGQGNFAQMNLLTGMMNYNPQAWARMAQQTGMMGQMAAAGVAPPVDINAQGQVTGMPQFYSNITSSQAQGMWGSGWQNRGYLSAGVTGWKNPNTGEVIKGYPGIQLAMSEASYNYQMAQAGVASQQVQMQLAFQTGVGINAYSGTVNPQTGQPFGFNTGKFGFNIPGAGSYKSQGGGFWGIEDTMRNLGYAQQQWQFQQSREQLAMSGRQFFEQQGLQQRQFNMQKGWTIEDWATNDRTRAMQWGWKVEDFQENLRFMTGRDRRLAERQMGRETVMHNIEEEQIGKQKDRQQELWKLEEERFKMTRKQFLENQKFQENAIKMQEKFFEERKKLEEEQIKLSRAYFIQGLNLQKQQIAAQAKYAKDIYDTQQGLTLLNREQDKNLDNWKTAAEYSDKLVPLFDAIADAAIKLDAAGVINIGKKNNGTQETGKEGDYIPQAFGTDMIVPPGHPNDSYGPVWLSSGERLKVEAPGDFKLKSPWEQTSEVFTPTPQIKGSEPITLIINIGSERIYKIITDAVSKELSVR